jgi:hypothetical protein
LRVVDWPIGMCLTSDNHRDMKIARIGLNIRKIGIVFLLLGALIVASQTPYYGS